MTVITWSTGQHVEVTETTACEAHQDDLTPCPGVGEYESTVCSVPMQLCRAHWYDLADENDSLRTFMTGAR